MIDVTITWYCICSLGVKALPYRKLLVDACLPTIVHAPCCFGRDPRLVLVSAGTSTRPTFNMVEISPKCSTTPR